MEKLYYTIGEVADILGENVSLVRFWSDTFSKFIKPSRNNKGNRMFTAGDIEIFKQIHFLVRDCGLTLEGAAKKLQTDKVKVEKSTKVVESLRNMREQLAEVRKSL